MIVQKVQSILLNKYNNNIIRVRKKQMIYFIFSYRRHVNSKTIIKLLI